MEMGDEAIFWESKAVGFRHGFCSRAFIHLNKFRTCGRKEAAKPEWMLTLEPANHAGPYGLASLPKGGAMPKCIRNQPENTQDPAINNIRSAMIHRGVWMGFLLKEAKNRGLDWEQLGHSAIFEVGCIHGDAIKGRMDVPGSLVSFANTFFTEDLKKIFEVEVKELTEQVLRLEYGYCPLLSAWQQMGIEGEMLEKLCDIAMSGDRGIESRFDEFEFKLGRTIAQGHNVCEVCFTRKPISPINQ
jgi:hypothetical protein